MRRFFALPEHFTESEVILDLEETRHLRDVLRLRVGIEVQIFDGTGREFLCSIKEIGKKETVLKIESEITPTAPESALELTLGVALLKGEKFDLVVQKAVELGVTNLIPLVTQHSDIKLKNADTKLPRWRKIALEACKQSGRARLLKIALPLDFQSFVKTADGAKVLFAERGGRSFNELKSDKKMTAVVGPEGGWEKAEIDLAAAHGFQIITLGGRVLRAETAAIAVAVILQNRFGDLR